MRLAPVLAFVVMACGGGSGGDNGLEAESFPAEFLRVECEAAARCTDYETVAKCEATVPIDRFYAQAVLGVAAGVVRFDARTAAACLDYRRNADCRSKHRTHDDPCLRVYVGLVANGAACEFNEECASRRCVVTDPSCEGDGCCAGTCMPSTEIRNVPIGGTCSSDGNCTDDAYCNALEKCAALVEVEGAPCEEVFDCAEPLFCNTVAAQPTCMRSAEPGAACDENVPGPCIDSRDTCLAGTCQRRLAPGASCVERFDCVGYATCEVGMCVAQLGAGDACDPAEQSCRGLTSCQDSVCTVVDPSPVCEP
jgi:hypothetical protein